MRVSARLRNLVYPAVWQSDNHWSNGQGHRTPRYALRYSRSLAIDRRRPGRLDQPLEPVIGRRVAPTRWRAMTAGNLFGVTLPQATHEKPPALVPRVVRTIASKDLGNRSAPGASRAGSGSEGVPQGTRASANTSGPDFTWAKTAGEIADQRSAPNEENSFLLPDRFSKNELFESTIQPFDLMSRRHPLSSTRAA
jgi:hypothetical protein